MEMLISWFGRVWLSSLEAVFAVGIVWLLATAFRRKLAPQWRYALWLLVLVKLAMPWLPGDPGQFLQWIHIDRPAEIVQYFAESDSAHQAGSAGGLQPRSPESGPASGQSAAPAAPLRDHLRSVAAFVWLAGTMVTLSCIGLSHIRLMIRLRRERRPAVPAALESQFRQLCRRNRIRAGIRLRVTALTPSPALFGLFKPTILVPDYLLDELSGEEWECIFQHELSHYKRLDLWVNGILAVAAAIHWFNPAVWYGAGRLRQEQEAACDARALATLSSKDIYAGCIVKLLELGSHLRTRSAGVAFSAYKQQTIRRITMIRDFQSFNKRKWLFGMLILIAAALIALPSALAGGETGKELPGEAAEQEMRDSNSSRPSQQQDEPEEGLLMEWPAEGKVTFSFGYSTAGKKADFHDGIDIANDPGTEVAAAAAGTVLEAGYSGKNGKYIVIEHDDNWRTEYRHLSELTVDEGRAVEAGEFIGRMGSTGSATGPHLHFSIMKDGEYIDPMTVLKQP